MGQGIKLSEIAEKMDLKNLTPDVSLSDKEVHVPDINRPALQLAGYFDHFDSDRVQIIGYVEYTYLQTLTEEKKRLADYFIRDYFEIFNETYERCGI